MSIRSQSNLFALKTRRDDLRNTSVLEIMLIIVFIALILLGGALAQLGEYENEIKDFEAAELSTEQLLKELAAATTAKKNLEGDNEDFQKRIETLLSQNAALEGSSEEMRSALGVLDDVRDALADVNVNGRKGAEVDLDDAVTHLVDVAEKYREAQEEAQREREYQRNRREFDRENAGPSPDEPNSLDKPKQSASDELRDALDQLRRKEQEARDWEAQFKAASAELFNLKERTQKVNPRQRGWIPCWESPQGKLQAIYKVTISDRFWRVERAWPGSRTAEVRNTPALRLPSISRLTLDQWKRFGQAVYNHGLENNNCRFVVRMVDNTTGKETYRTGLVWTQRYFVIL